MSTCVPLSLSLSLTDSLIHTSTYATHTRHTGHSYRREVMTVIWKSAYHDMRPDKSSWGPLTLICGCGCFSYVILSPPLSIAVMVAVLVLPLVPTMFGDEIWLFKWSVILFTFGDGVEFLIKWFCFSIMAAVSSWVTGFNTCNRCVLTFC